VTFGREAIPVSSYPDDTRLTGVETWADTVPAFA
jgi:hypothetical protein